MRLRHGKEWRHECMTGHRIKACVHVSEHDAKVTSTLSWADIEMDVPEAKFTRIDGFIQGLANPSSRKWLQQKPMLPKNFRQLVFANVADSSKA